MISGSMMKRFPAGFKREIALALSIASLMAGGSRCITFSTLILDYTMVDNDLLSMF